MKRIWRFRFLIIVLAPVLSSPLFAADSQAAIAKLAAAFKSGAYNDAAGSVMPYRYFEPTKTKGKYLPLVLYLHGEDERGTDNSAQLTTTECATIWTEGDHQQANPSYVLAPQLPQGKSWTDGSATASALGLLKKFLFDHPDIEPNRIYVVGFSMGGSATWQLAIKNPSLFAAALVISANADAYSSNKEALVPLKNMAIMVVHSMDDPIVPVDSANKMVRALADSGNISVQANIWQNGSVAVPHNAWYPAFHNYEVVYNWLYSQDLAKTFYGEIAPGRIYTSKSLGNGITQIWDIACDTAFVIEKYDKVLIIDSTQGAGNLYYYIRDKILINRTIPIELAVTHNNGDHVRSFVSMNGIDQVKKFYISKEDYYYSVVTRSFRDADKVQFVKEGDAIQLGGKAVEIIEVPGHPMGALCFLYENYLFTGDAVGSGDVFLQNSEPSMEEYQKNVNHLLDKVKGVKDLTVLVGHTGEVRGGPFTIEYINQMSACAKGIVDGSLPLTKYRRRVASYATVGKANIVFQTWNIKTKPGVLTALYLKDGKGNDISLPLLPGKPTGFISDVTNYAVNVASDVDRIWIRPTTVRSNQTVTIAAGSNAPAPLPWRTPYTADLVAGRNSFTIIASEGNVSTKYILVINRK